MYKLITIGGIDMFLNTNGMLNTRKVKTLTKRLKKAEMDNKILADENVFLREQVKSQKVRLDELIAQMDGIKDEYFEEIELAKKIQKEYKELVLEIAVQNE